VYNIILGYKKDDNVTNILFETVLPSFETAYVKMYTRRAILQLQQ